MLSRKQFCYSLAAAIGGAAHAVCPKALIGATEDSKPAIQGLIGMYFNLPRDSRNIPMAPDPAPAFVRIDPVINFDWSRQAPVPRLGLNNYAVRWSGFIWIATPGVHTFRLTHDRGLRVQIGQRLFYDKWAVGALEVPVDLRLDQSGWQPFEVQFHSTATRRPRVRLEWARPGAANIALIPGEVLAHVSNS